MRRSVVLRHPVVSSGVTNFVPDSSANVAPQSSRTFSPTPDADSGYQAEKRQRQIGRFGRSETGH